MQLIINDIIFSEVYLFSKASCAVKRNLGRDFLILIHLPELANSSCIQVIRRVSVSAQKDLFLGLNGTDS